MCTDHYFDSHGEGKIHYCRWIPEGKPKAVVQIVHGIAEHVERYEHFANYLNARGIAVVAEDHMGHGKSMLTGTRGYFAGGWFAAVADTYRLLELTKEELPDVPYFLFGHSMGSFMTRTILAEYPDSGITGAVICGTGWMPGGVLKAGKLVADIICRTGGGHNPSTTLQKLMFGSYNNRVEHPRTEYDWLNRDSKAVDAYVADPLCGFTPGAGLARDMLTGIMYIQQPDTLAAMDPELPVLFIAGGDDPVGDYGKGVRRAAAEFRNAGMKRISQRIYPLCRHEILNEINKTEIYEDVYQWMHPLMEG